MNQANLYSFTAKHLWLLFFIVIPVNIFDILTTELFASHLPSTIYSFCNYGIIICNLLYGLILLKLSKEHDFYKTAGIISIFSVLINLWFTFINGGPLESMVSDGFGFGVLALAFISIVCNILIIFFETNGHADILGRYDYELSSKWDKLRKWYIYLLWIRFKFRYHIYTSTNWIINYVCFSHHTLYFCNCKIYISI